MWGVDVLNSYIATTCKYRKMTGKDKEEDTPIYEPEIDIKCHSWGGYEVNVKSTGDAIISTKHYILDREVYKDDMIDGRRVQGCSKNKNLATGDYEHEAIVF